MSGGSGMGMGQHVAPGSGGVNAEPNPALRRYLLIAIFGMPVLALAAVGAIVFKLAQRPKTPLPADRVATVPELILPAGGTVQSVQVSGDRLVVQLRGGQGDEIDLFDTHDGRLIARIRQAPAAARP